ncbi:MAG: PH domain-containing protein [Candidatus Limnocylindrales bacterium]
MPGETVVLEAKKHWIAPVRDSLWPALMILGAFLIGWISPNQEGGLFGAIGRLLDLIRLGLFLGGLGWIVYNIVVWRTAEFAVTNFRVLRYEGLIQRRTSETLLTSVTDVRLGVGVLGKSLGYGDLKIFTASGAAGEDDFKTITQATEFRNAMMAQKLQDQQASRATAPAAAPPAAAPPPATAASPAPPAANSADRLQQLTDLRDKGLITPQEYEAKKAEILQRL